MFAGNTLRSLTAATTPRSHPLAEEAFTSAWYEIAKVAPRTMIEETREELRRRIFQLVERGESDPKRLTASAVALMRL